MPQRSFGSVSKGELLKQIFAGVTGFKVAGVDSPLTQIGAYPVALVDTANDEAFIQIWVPNCFTTLYSSSLIFIGVANIAAMHFDQDLMWCTPQRPPAAGEAYNINNVTPEIVTQTWANGASAIDLDFAGGIPVRAGQMLGIRIIYRAADAHTATNFYVLGAILRWI